MLSTVRFAYASFARVAVVKFVASMSASADVLALASPAVGDLHHHYCLLILVNQNWLSRLRQDSSHPFFSFFSHIGSKQFVFSSFDYKDVWS